MKRHMCDEKIDHPLLGPRWYHRALDVSMLLSHLPVETDITHTRKTNTASTHVFHHVEDGSIVNRVHMVQVSVIAAVSHIHCELR